MVETTRASIGAIASIRAQQSRAIGTGSIGFYGTKFLLFRFWNL